jgi:hypothetical protein
MRRQSPSRLSARQHIETGQRSRKLRVFAQSHPHEKLKLVLREIIAVFGLHGVLDVAPHVGYSTTPGVYTRLKHDRQAAAVFVEISDRLDPDVAINLVSALYLMRELTPSRFTADSRTGSRDSTFDHTLGNVLKRSVGANRRFTNTPGKRMKVSQKELMRKTRLRLAELIRTALGAVGVHLARIEADRLTDAKAREARFKAALASIS